MFRLGIDARVLARLPHHGLGVWRYLVRILERAPTQGWSITLFTDRPAETLPVYALPATCTYRHVASPAGLRSDAAWEQIALPLDRVFRQQPLFWSPSYSTPLLTRVPRVVTMHDISFDQPPPGEGRGPFRMRWIGRQSAAAARLVLTDSNFSADQIREHWKVPANQLQVIPLAADEPNGLAQCRQAETLQRLGVARPFVLHVGTMYSRRHVGTLLRAVAPLLATRTSWQTVVVGRNRTHPHDDLEGQMAAVNTDRGRQAVVHLPFVSDDDLEVLYASASVFVYLSSLEGFGIPPLEAMAYGVPVVSTTGGSLAEITPGAATIVDPRDVDAVRRGVANLMDDPAQVAAHAARSAARAREFSWDRCATNTWAALAGASVTSA